MGFIYATCHYNDVRRYGIIIVAYIISEIEMESLSQAHSFRMHTRRYLIDRSSISGTASDHITMQVLYQEIISPHESKPIEFWNELKPKHSKTTIGTTVPKFDISCQTTDETKPPTKVLEERSSQSDLHCVSETYIYMYAIFKNAKETHTRLMTNRFNAGHIKVT